MKTLAILIMGVISLSLFVSTASAQDCIPNCVAGSPVPIDSSELFVSLITSNLLWIIPVATAGVVVFKIKSKRK